MSLFNRLALTIRKIGYLANDINDATIQGLGTFRYRSKTSGITTITDITRKTFTATANDKLATLLDLICAVFGPA